MAKPERSQNFMRSRRVRPQSSQASPFFLLARAAFSWPAHHARLSSSAPHADHHHGEPAHFKFGTARRAPHDADARSPSSYHTSPQFKMSEAARQGKGGYTHKA